MGCPATLVRDLCLAASASTTPSLLPLAAQIGSPLNLGQYRGRTLASNNQTVGAPGRLIKGGHLSSQSVFCHFIKVEMILR